MKQGRKLPKEEKIRIANAVLSVYAGGEHTVEGALASIGDAPESDTTLYNWASEIGEIGEAFKKAKFLHERNRKVLHRRRVNLLAETAMERKLQNRQLIKRVEKRDPEGNILEEVVTNQEVEPSDTLIMMALTNTDPDNWKNNHSGNVNVNFGNQVVAFNWGDKMPGNLTDKDNIIDLTQEV